MLTYWMDLSDPLRAFDTLRRQVDQVFREFDETSGSRNRTLAFPRATLRDTKEAFVLTAEVPGLTEKDLQLTATQDSLTVAGERKPSNPEGYAVHRRERGELKFSRSFTLPARIDVERVGAEVKNGLLTVTMPKHPEAQPRSIAVKTS
jgi:HSP20 family protein